MLGLRLVNVNGGSGFVRDDGVIVAADDPSHVKPFRFQQGPQIHFPCHATGCPSHKSTESSIQLSKTPTLPHEKPSRKSPDDGTPNIRGSIVPNSGRSNSRRQRWTKGLHTSKCCVGILENMDDPKINPGKPVGLPRIDKACSGQPFSFGCLNQHVFKCVLWASSGRHLCIRRDGLCHPCLVQRRGEDNHIGGECPVQSSVQIENKRKSTGREPIKMRSVDIVGTFGRLSAKERRYVGYALFFWRRGCKCGLGLRFRATSITFHC